MYRAWRCVINNPGPGSALSRPGCADLRPAIDKSHGQSVWYHGGIAQDANENETHWVHDAPRLSHVGSKLKQLSSESSFRV